ncbi:MAG TPA: permease-like cell division protein FtsX [Kofleriaceae bacterium]|nr:permease-like cell division protein FtsX [Kofleriaceae bacterium]
MIHRLGSALRRTLRIALRRPRAGAWSVLALSCALFVAGIAAIGAASLDRWARAHPAGGGSLVVYLGDEVDDARAQALVGELRGLRGVERAGLVSPAESAQRLARALGPDPALLEGVDATSLPASVEVKLAPGVREVVAMSPTVRALRGAPGVADLVVEDGGQDRLPAALLAARDVAWPIAAALAALALAIALAAARIRCERSKREARVLELLGAPPGFAAFPSALAGALHGVIGALVAAIALAAVLAGHPAPVASIDLAPPPPAAFALLIALGAAVGLVGGGLAGVARAR